MRLQRLKITLLAAVFTGLAFGTAHPGESVSDIRKLYETSKRQTEELDNGNGLGYKITAGLTRTVPGTGPQTYAYNLYVDGEYNMDEPSTPKYRLFFATCSYNVAARNFYEEALWNRKEEPIFFFYKFADFELGEMEIRMYFSDKRLFKALIKQKAPEAKDFKTVYDGGKSKIPDKYKGFCNAEEKIANFYNIYKNAGK